MAHISSFFFFSVDIFAHDEKKIAIVQHFRECGQKSIDRYQMPKARYFASLRNYHVNKHQPCL